MRREQLDMVKLVDDDASDEQLVSEVERCVQQYAGWGVTKQDRLTLGLAIRLRNALEVAEKLEDVHKKLKGVQLENGRLKKKLGAKK